VGWYEAHLFNAALDFGLDREPVHAERRALLSQVRGDVLEIGLGTGLNFPDYPPGVARVRAVAREERLSPKALARAREREIELEHVCADAHALPLEPESFDSVVCTFVLCSVDSPAQVLGELRRVLRPVGRLFLLEHVESGRPFARWTQRALTPLWRHLACGCHLDRQFGAQLPAFGFRWIAVQEGPSDAIGWPACSLLRGVAEKLP
jgi:ubiquinone/menaquinone biosynthesis C-methylase UbiE